MEAIKRVSVPTREEGRIAIVDIAERFETIYDDSELCELDYLEEIQKFGTAQFMIWFGIE